MNPKIKFLSVLFRKRKLKQFFFFVRVCVFTEKNEVLKNE